MAGTFAAGSTKACPWLLRAKTPATTEKKKITKAKKEPPIKNPRFLECVNVTNDPYWKEMFIKASLGKLPRRFFFSNDVLTYRKNTTITSLTFPDSPYEAASLCASFFRQFGGFYSPEDVKLSHINDNIPDAEKTWGRTSRRMREILIDNYTSSICDKYNLNEEVRKQLFETLFFGTAMGYYNKNNITLVDGVIQSIDGLEYDGSKFIITAKRPSALDKEPNVIPLNLNKRVRPLPNINKEWDLFLEGLNPNKKKEEINILNSLRDISESLNGDISTSTVGLEPLSLS